MTFAGFVNGLQIACGHPFILVARNREARRRKQGDRDAVLAWDQGVPPQPARDESIEKPRRRRFDGGLLDRVADRRI